MTVHDDHAEHVQVDIGPRVGDLLVAKRKVQAERDEARAEVERLRAERDEVRRIFREGYLPRIPGENATIRGKALAALAAILLDGEERES